MQLLRRYLILFHRYLGIPLSFMFAIWFVSGIAMIYVGGMPELTPEERLAHLPPLDLAAVRLTPAEASRQAELGIDPDVVTLTTVELRPAYRFAAPPFGTTTVFADDGGVLEPLDPAAARSVAARFLDMPETSAELCRYFVRPRSVDTAARARTCRSTSSSPPMRPAASFTFRPKRAKSRS